MAAENGMKIQFYRNSTPSEMSTVGAKEKLQSQLKGGTVSEGEPVMYSFKDSQHGKAPKTLLGIKDKDNGTQIFEQIGKTSSNGGELFNAATSAGLNAHAEGNGTTATGDSSHAEGMQTIAGGWKCIKAYKGTTGIIHNLNDGAETVPADLTDPNSYRTYWEKAGKGSHAEGWASKVYNDYSHVEGGYSTASGVSSHAEGAQTTASGLGSHAEGFKTTASGVSSHTEGYQTTAFGKASHVEGVSSNTTPDGTDLTNNDAIKTAWESTNFSLAKGEASHVSGTDCLALGDNSFACGNWTIASGNASYAEGNRTIASHVCSHAEGHQTTAAGLASHAEGYGTLVSKDTEGAHAEGNSTIASGDASHAEGASTIAYGNASHVSGASNNPKTLTIKVTAIYSNITDNNIFYIQITDAGASNSIATSLTPNSIVKVDINNGTNFHMFKLISIELTYTSEGIAYYGCYIDVNPDTIGLEQDKTYMLTVYNIGTSIDDYSASFNESRSSGKSAFSEGRSEAFGSYSHAEGLNSTLISDEPNMMSSCTNIEISAISRKLPSEDTQVITLVDNNSALSKIIPGSYITLRHFVNHNKGISFKVIDAPTVSENTSSEYNITISTKYSNNYILNDGDVGQYIAYITLPITDNLSQSYLPSSIGFASHSEGLDAFASGDYSHAQGNSTIAIGESSFASGNHAAAIGISSFAHGSELAVDTEMTNTKILVDKILYGRYGVEASDSVTTQISIGSNISINGEGAGHPCQVTDIEIVSVKEPGLGGTSTNKAHIYFNQPVPEFVKANAVMDISFNPNYQTTAKGHGAIAMGINAVALGDSSVAIGRNVRAHSGEFVIGRNSTNGYDFPSKFAVFRVGGGAEFNTPENALILNGNGNLTIAGSLTQNGADYAEMFEWEDGNINNENRTGLIVELHGDKIAPANGGYVVGVVSSNPSTISNAPSFWHNKYKKNEWGQFILDENNQRIISEEYDPTQEYIPRTYRQEWSPIGMTGQLLVKQDGTLTVGSYCLPVNGIATKSDTGYYVMKIIDANKALIIVK